MVALSSIAFYFVLIEFVCGGLKIDSLKSVAGRKNTPRCQICPKGEDLTKKALICTLPLFKYHVDSIKN